MAPRFRRSTRKPAAVPVRATRITSTGACAKVVGTRQGVHAGIVEDLAGRVGRPIGSRFRRGGTSCVSSP